MGWQEDLENHPDSIAYREGRAPGEANSLNPGGAPASGGGSNSVAGIMDSVARERDPRLQQERTYYDPYGSESGTSAATGLAAFGEGIGTASAYRSPGYRVDRNPGYVGGSAGTSAAQQQYYADLARSSRNTANPFMRDYGTGLNASMDSRAQQMQGLGMTAEAAQMYKGMYDGTGPSLAKLQLQKGLQQSQAAQASMAAGARGGGANLAAAQLAASTMAGQQAAGYNQQAAQLRAQEQLGAMQGYAGMSGQYGALSGQMRGQDLGYAGLGSQMYGTQLQDARAFEEMRQQQQLGELGAQTELEKTQGQLALQRQQQVGQQAQASASEGSGLFGGVLGALGKLSDARTKTDVRDASADIDAKLDKLRPLSWRYKDEPEGTKRLGPMAQQMPPETVMEVGGLKVIRQDAADGFGLAALARINDRLRELEKSRAEKKMNKG